MPLRVDGVSKLVALRPIVDYFGVDYSGQLQKLKGKSWATMGKISTVADDGKTREMVGIDRRTLGMWLGNLDENRVLPERVQDLRAYQAEAADALDAYFHDGIAVREVIDLSDPIAAIEAANTRSQHAIEIAKSERKARIAAESEAKTLTAAIERDAPLVAKAEAHTGSDSSVHRQEFAREVITWGLRQHNITIMQADVMRFLGHIGLFIRGERTDTGHATADALKRGLAFTDKGTAKNGHAWATGKLTARGQDYAWKRITKHVADNGTLELPRELRGGDPA